MSHSAFFQSVCIFAATLLTCNAFAPLEYFTRASWNLQALPSNDALRSDGFMDQVGHASELINMIGSNDMDQVELTDMLKLQLSHSNGIRGFFVNYLTMDDGPADLEDVPEPVMTDMASIDDQTDLVALSCMNVIMPTAMATIHTKQDLQENSRKTAIRGVKILMALRSNPEVKLNAKAIYAAATKSHDSDADPSLVDYWSRFLDNYGYQQQQQSDIAEAMKQFLF